MRVLVTGATGTFEVEVDNYSEKDSLNSLGAMLELINVDSFNVFHKIEFSDVNIRI